MWIPPFFYRNSELLKPRDSKSHSKMCHRPHDLPRHCIGHLSFFFLQTGLLPKLLDFSEPLLIRATANAVRKPWKIKNIIITIIMIPPGFLPSDSSWRPAGPNAVSPEDQLRQLRRGGGGAPWRNGRSSAEPRSTGEVEMGQTGYEASSRWKGLQAFGGDVA